MPFYLLLAGVNLTACILAAGWWKLQGLPSTPVFLLFITVYFLSAPALFLIRARRGNPDLPGAAGAGIYLLALVLSGLTAAYSWAFYLQFVTVRPPIVVLDPPLLTLLFLGIYLPAASALCYTMARLSLRKPVPRPILLAKPSQAIPIPHPPTVEKEPALVSLSPVSEPPKPKGLASEFKPVYGLTIDRPGIITASKDDGPTPDTEPMETPETQRLQTILSLFSASAGITVAALRSWEKDLFNPAGENPVCRAAQKTTAGRDHCRSHCGRSVDLSLEEKETHFFKCALNLHAFSIPLKLEDGSPVVIQGGRCFLEAAEAAELSRKLEALSVPPGDISALQPVSGIRDPFTLAQSVKFLEKVLPGLFSSSGENKRMGDRLSRLTTLFSLTSDMRENPANLIPTLVNSLGLLFNLETAGVFITGDKPGPLKAAATFGRKSPVLQGLEMDLSRGLYRDLIEQGAPVTSSNTLDILRSGFPAGVSSVHLFSLFQKEGRTTGILAIIDTVLSEEDIQLIRAYCLQASTIQENHQLREERVDLAQDVSVLLEIAKTVGSALDSKDLLSIILEKATQFLEAEQGSLMLLDEERDELTVKAMKGFNRKIVELLRIRRGEGISGKVLDSGEAVVVSDIESDNRFGKNKRPRYKTKSFICAPLKLNSRVIGILNVTDKTSGSTFSSEDLHLVLSIGTYAAVAIDRSKYYHKTEELKKISITDSMTGLLNRRYFQERISEEMERSRRHSLPLSLIMIDVDDFKGINDAHGHLIGDEVLKIASRSIRNSIRAIDVAARYGGEEFTVILPQTSKADAFTIAERICSEVRQLDFPFIQSDHKMELSVSVGLATFPEDTENLEDLIRNADIALYNAKSQGKNRVTTYEP